MGMPKLDLSTVRGHGPTNQENSIKEAPAAQPIEVTMKLNLDKLSSLSETEKTESELNAPRGNRISLSLDNPTRVTDYTNELGDSDDPHPREYANVISKIEDWLFLSGMEPVSDLDRLKKLGITHVLNCARGVCEDHYPREFEYWSLNLLDSGGQNIIDLFFALCDWLEKIRENNQRVLVHCHAGVSRSATIVIAYLMWRQKLPFEKALLLAQEGRPICNPNGGFLAQLQLWGRLLGFGATTQSPVLLKFELIF
jgi:Predicted protein-tyrosine phosphatase